MPTESHEIVIVGAGFSGLGVAIALRRAGFDDILIVDEADAVGGVWHWNTYPGVAVDIPSFSYQFSFAQRTDWTRSYAKGAELKGYAEYLVDRFGLDGSFRFNTRVAAATYDESAHQWDLTTSTGDLTAKYLIHAGGPLSQPKYPDIDGLDSFDGIVMHTARWDHDVDLRGKRVGIIGTGASAVQIIPEIAPEVAELTVFQRTPIWCLPKFDFQLAGAFRTGMNRVPGVRQAARAASNLFVEATFPLLAHYNGVLHGTNLLEQRAIKYLKSQVKDPELQEKLTPNYGLGCKRPSFHNTYLSMFNRDNVTLETTGIAKATPSGVATVDGTEYELDVLLLATGFKVMEKDALPSYTLVGRGGLNLGEWWDTERLQAYQGVSSPGFPNFFTVFGPYAYNGSSYFQLIEATSAHMVRVLREARKRGAAEVEVTEAAHLKFMTEVMRRRKHQVFWQESCGRANSYYFDRHGDVPLRPALTPEVRWRNAHFPLSHYAFVA